MKHTQKGFIIPLVIIIVAILAIGAGVYFYQKSANTVPPVSVATTTSTAVATGTVTTSSSSGWSSYIDSQYGFSFLYPSTWPTPTKIISTGNAQINFGDQGLVIWDNQISTLGQSVTADDFIKKQEAQPNVQIGQMNISSGGVGTEISYKNNPSSEDVYIPDSQGNVIDIERFTNDDSGKSLDSSTFSKILASFKIFSPTPVSQNNQPNADTYSDSQLGISFQYPASFNSAYASLNSVSAFSGNTNIDSKGCLEAESGRGGPSDDSQDTTLTLNGMKFCLSSGGDPGAGQLDTTYDYTTYKNGNYITLSYTVHTSNGCGAYDPGSAGYLGCENLAANYDSIVIKPIEQSVGTLTFGAQNGTQTSCNTSNDCPTGDSCMAETPTSAKPINKVCVPPGQAVPL